MARLSSLSKTKKKKRKDKKDNVKQFTSDHKIVELLKMQGYEGRDLERKKMALLSPGPKT
jgi:hypothetical protein